MNLIQGNAGLSDRTAHRFGDDKLFVSIGVPLVQKLDAEGDECCTGDHETTLPREGFTLITQPWQDAG